MIILLATILTILNLAWLFLVILGLPGNWLMVIGAVALAFWQGSMFATWTLVAVVALAGVGELMEFLAGVLGSKKAGGTKRGAAGALVGGLVGGLLATFLIPFPVIGSLIGACVGAGVGAWGLELTGGLKMNAAMKSGVGAGVGRLVGTGVKLVAGAAIWLVLAIAAYWP